MKEPSNQLFSTERAPFVRAFSSSSSTCSRTTHKWKESQSVVIGGDDNSWRTHLLDCDWLYSGVHIWSVQVQDTIEGDIMLGVVSNHDVDNLALDTFLGHQTGGWSFGGYDGVRYEGSCRASRSGDDSLRLGKGSRVTLILDLTDDTNGTLSVSTDDGKSARLLCSNMMLSQQQGQIHSQEQKEHRSPVGFLPAVSMFYKDDQVKFLGFDLRLEMTTSLSVG